MSNQSVQSDLIIWVGEMAWVVCVCGLSAIKPDDMSLLSRYLDAGRSKLAPNVVFLASHAHRDTLPQSIHKQIVCLKENLTTESSRFNNFRQIT